MQLRIVGEKHYLCRYQEFAPSRLPKQAIRFWDTYDLGNGCDFAVCATHDGDLVGFFRFVMRERPAMLFAAGTWVHPNLRNAGNRASSAAPKLPIACSFATEIVLFL